MTLTPIWRVVDMTRNLTDGYVSNVSYVCEITYEQNDTTNSYAHSDVIELERPETLIPYADLTNDIVIGWVKEAIGAAACTATETKIVAEVNELLSPSLGYGTPW